MLGLVMALLLSGCGGGGGGDDDHTSIVQPVADFSPACDPADPCFPGSVTLQKGALAGEVVQIQVLLNKLNTTIGVASLVIGYDSTAVDYLGYSAGSALGSAPGTVYTVSEPGPGQVIATILPPAGGASVSTSQPLITLSFRVLRVEVTNLTLLNTDVLNGSALYDDGGILIPLGAGGWSGGMISGS